MPQTKNDVIEVHGVVETLYYCNLLCYMKCSSISLLILNKQTIILRHGCMCHLSFLTSCSLCSPSVNSFEVSNNQPMHIYTWSCLTRAVHVTTYVHTYMHLLAMHHLLALLPPSSPLHASPSSCVQHWVMWHWRSALEMWGACLYQ